MIVSMISGYLLLILAVSLVSSSLVRLPDIESRVLAAYEKADWWKTATIYQIYPKSFKDTNGDGIGDLLGIIEKLDYIKSLGVQAIWLSPIFDSPQKDSGYDISNYTKIWPTFGTMSEFEVLIDMAHEKGLKVIIDFVPNHTSDQHEWFKKSVKKEEGFEDFYVWKDCADEKGKFNRTPNNWESVFGGSAWTFNDVRKQCYLHQFLKEQPDLNYWNEDVVEEMQKIVEFWLRTKKVDGMRIDAVPHIFEAKDYGDEPYIIKNNVTSGLNHTKTRDQPETIKLIKELRKILNVISRQDTRIAFTEATDLRYYGDNKTDGAHFTFNFRFLNLTSASTPKEIGDIIRTYTEELRNISAYFVPNWVLGNHDTHRIASKVGVNKVDGLNMLTAFLPGIQVTYQGEELGMINGRVDCATEGVDFKDDCKTYPQKTRDYERTPFQWSAGEKAGFTEAKPWLPISDNYKTVNVEVEQNSSTSHLNVYIAAQSMRLHLKRNASATVKVLSKSDDKVLYLRRNRIDYDDVYDFFFNMYDKTLNITLKPTGNVELLASSKGKKQISDPSGKVIVLEGYESVVVAYREYRSGAPILAMSYVFVLTLAMLTRF